MTEDEAKTKLCPQTMASNDWDKCQGSACMAWRWSELPRTGNPEGIVMDVTANYGSGRVDRYKVDSRQDNPGEGYCGLAGKP